ncbi:pheromone A receptor-domain-containing protein [Gymnopilus junonius]|uniref:Pheromone A receptor-domain-containing protein n=1 Tax=Gymnopilus junonius TaxID=109634 RepID=A0A9P5NGZ6_GYMJU|nr:pheromone A receptor-domain-containing protein [Gymnopilus junonius]
MAVTLAVLCLVCVGLLAVFVPIQRVRTNIPNLALVLWLLAYNAIHAVDTIVWAGTVDIHIPVWCDIVTKLMLAANVALPGALLCIATQLELVTSSRTIPTNKKVLRNRMIFEFTICYVVPLLYMLLHFVAQDRRFDLLENYGCFPSVHPSTLAFLIVWIPPLAMSGTALVVYGISIHNIGILRGTYLTGHLEARSTMNSSMFYRRLITGMVITGTLILISLSSLFSVHSFQSWTSWKDVHSSMAKIEVLKSSDDITSILFSWWAYFAVSCLYIFLSLLIGEETRDIYRWLAKHLKSKEHLRTLILPLHISKKWDISPEMMARPSPEGQLGPLTVGLKSGWDDRWDNRPVPKGSNRSTKSSSSCPSPTSVKESVMDEDLEFMTSTLSYLRSPSAKSLGIATPLQVPPPVKTPPPRTAFEIPPKPSSPPPLPKPILKTPQNVPVDVEPSINSVFDVAWPIPPSSPTRSLSRSCFSSGSRSPSHSPASSAEEVDAYPLYPAVTPVHPRSRPFEDSCISFHVASVPSSPGPPIKKTIPKRPSLQNLRRTWSKERLEQGHDSVEVIHMTIVQETA